MFTQNLLFYFSEPNVSIDKPSPPLDFSKPFGEFDFKPIINPPPDFYKFRPVVSNPFSTEDLLLSAPRAQSKDTTLDQSIDTISAPFVPPDLIHPVEYDDVSWWLWIFYDFLILMTRTTFAVDLEEYSTELWPISPLCQVGDFVDLTDS